MRALASAVGRESGGEAMAPLIVKGISASSWDRLPNDTYAVAVALFGSLRRPDSETLFRLLFGQIAIRPLAGPDDDESVERSGLLQTSVLMLFVKNEPS